MSWASNIPRTRRPLAVPWVLAFSAIAFAGPAACRGQSSELDRAYEACQRDDHAAAIASFRAVLGAEPFRRDSISLDLASQLTWAGSYREAIEEFRWFLDRHPERVNGWMSLALAQAWGGRTRQAIESYRRAAELDPSRPEARLGEARMLSWLGEGKRAVDAYERVLLDFPDCVDARVALARSPCSVSR